MLGGLRIAPFDPTQDSPAWLTCLFRMRATTTISDTFLPYAKVDPDLELLRKEPRYLAMLAKAEARLAGNAGLQVISAT